MALLDTDTPPVRKRAFPAPSLPGSDGSAGSAGADAAAPPAPPARSRVGRAADALRARPELVALLVLAGVLNLWALDLNGYANDYYAAAVRSMTESWKAFVYGSFDTSNVMTVDKPPLALWIQALSARAFGFSSWSLLVPQALMGVASVGLTYDLVRRRFGRAAGLAGGLALALTPAMVAVSRHNNPDALLVLCSVAALWFGVRALETGRTRWLVWAGVAIGLGFEAKMAAALMVLPGLVLAYLWIAPRGRWVAVRQLLAGGVSMAVVGLVWPVLVWLTPAADRPWVSGTSDNSIWSLIMGYNGLGRLFGQDGGPGGAGGTGGGPGGAGAGGGVFGGDTGVTRLLNEALGGQAGWLLGFAVVGGLALLAVTRLRRGDERTGWLIAVGGAFAVTAVAFSTAQGIFHPYYVSLLAPFTAGLVGATVGLVLRGGLVARVFGPLAIAGGVATSLVVLGDNTDSLAWWPPVLGAIAIAAACALAFDGGHRMRRAALGVGVAALLFAPGVWAFQTLDHATSSTFPAGGPASAASMGGPGGGGGPAGGGGGQGVPPQGFTPPNGTQSQGGFAPPTQGGGGMFGGNTQSLTEAIAYAKANGGGTIAVSSQSGAASSMIADGADVAALGGFSGRESQVSTEWLADAVESGKIRYVLASSDSGGMQDSRTGASDVLAAAAEAGTAVDSIDGLYDLQGKADALRALAS
jgi:4-amino-4-deoxy-L-arabinose transferase-like glycosyltransferase